MPASLVPGFPSMLLLLMSSGHPRSKSSLPRSASCGCADEDSSEEEEESEDEEEEEEESEEEEGGRVGNVRLAKGAGRSVRSAVSR